MNLQGKHVVITGASSGVGAALAQQLVNAAPERISLMGRSQGRLEEVKALVEEQVPCGIYAGDLGDVAFVEKAFADMLSLHPSIDIVASNAGLGLFGEFEALGVESDMQMINANIIGMANVMRAVIPSMKSARKGHIVVTASDVSKRPIDGGVIYCATKYAQEGMLASLRKELRPFGIKVSGVYSGLIATRFHESLGQEAADWLTPDDVASTIAYIIQAPRHVVIDELMVHPISQEY